MIITIIEIYDIVKKIEREVKLIEKLDRFLTYFLGSIAQTHPFYRTISFKKIIKVDLIALYVLIFVV